MKLFKRRFGDIFEGLCMSLGHEYLSPRVSYWGDNLRTVHSQRCYTDQNWINGGLRQRDLNNITLEVLMLWIDQTDKIYQYIKVRIGCILISSSWLFYIIRNTHELTDIFHYIQPLQNHIVVFILSPLQTNIKLVTVVEKAKYSQLLRGSYSSAQLDH